MSKRIAGKKAAFTRFSKGIVELKMNGGGVPHPSLICI
jgi:hypothetical protein